MNLNPTKKSLARLAITLAAGSVSLLPGFATVLDNFDAAQRTGWTDSNPGGLSQLQGGQQANGVFTFDLPAIGQPFFVDSTKTSPTFELKEGRTIEFRVDLVSGKGPDSYAVLAFIPTSTGADTLGGYGLAKSESDTIISKGISQYFIDDSSTTVKNNNVTLVLNLSVKGGNVYVTGQILDKDANNAVLWEKTFVDTAGADIMDTGTDSPPAPYVTTGNFVLYLYADNGTDPSGYEVVYDNAEYFVTDSAVLDDFNAAQRSGWTDSNPGGLDLKGGEQANGVFTFSLPAVGQPFFIDSTKTSKTFSLDEGTRHEFSVDMVSGNGPDSYAVLAFVPLATGADTLAGYGFAKSESDVLITKGINQYFIDYSDTAIKNNNVTLVLTLTVRNGTVTIRGRILDKDNNNAVLWDQTFTDTTAADILGTGTDSPPAPYVGMSGNVVLYLYADNGTAPGGYQVVLDNLMAAEPPGATNAPPVIADPSPKNGAAFVNSPATLTFTAVDDKPLPDSGISVSLNGQVFTTANGVTLSGPTTNRTVTLASGIGVNSNYVANLMVTDSDNAGVTNTVYFDTFVPGDRVVEVEDYNFDGQFINDPVPAWEGTQTLTSYNEMVGLEGIDFHDTRPDSSGADFYYRSLDPVRVQHTLDQPRAKYDPNGGIYGYDVIDIAADEWLNYTRNFEPGNYEVYLRESVVGFAEADSVLEMVTGDTTTTNQSVSLLGSFLGKLSGFTFRNVPLTDGSGLNKIVLRLSGTNTLRLHQLTGDTESASRYQNYLVFVPVSGSGAQRAIVTSLQPAPDSTIQTVAPAIAVSIQNRDTSVDTNSIVLQVNNQVVTTANIQGTTNGATVTWTMSPLPPSGVLNTASISFNDNQGTNQTAAWNFTITYPFVDPANAQAVPGPTRGMQVRVVQAPPGSALANSLDRAEQQLAQNSSIPVAMSTNVVLDYMSMTKNAGPFGGFTSFTDIPGIDGSIGFDDFAVEAQTWLQLTKGVYSFGVYSDDGYKISAGASPAAQTPLLAFHSGGTANETNDFVVPADGVYPFRFMWYQRGGDAYAQWYSVNRSTGERLLINDPSSPNAVKAYLSAAAPALRLQSSTQVGSGYADDATAVIDTSNKKITIPVNGPQRFYRLVGTSALRITGTVVQGGNVVLTYQ